MFIMMVSSRCTFKCNQPLASVLGQACPRRKPLDSRLGGARGAREKKKLPGRDALRTSSWAAAPADPSAPAPNTAPETSRVQKSRSNRGRKPICKGCGQALQDSQGTPNASAGLLPVDRSNLVGPQFNGRSRAAPRRRLRPIMNHHPVDGASTRPVWSQTEPAQRCLP